MKKTAWHRLFVTDPGRNPAQAQQPLYCNVPPVFFNPPPSPAAPILDRPGFPQIRKHCLSRDTPPISDTPWVEHRCPQGPADPKMNQHQVQGSFRKQYLT